MIFKSISFVFVLALLSSHAAASTEEILRGTFYNHNIHPSTSEVEEVMKKVDLASHGYSTEVTTKLVEGPSSSQRYYQKSYFLYKVVNCSRIQEVEQELDTLIPGVFGKELASKLSKEVKARRLNNMGQCKAGLEVLVTETRNQPGNKRSGVPGKIHDISVGFEFGSSSSSEKSTASNDDDAGGKSGCCGLLWGRRSRRSDETESNDDDSRGVRSGSGRGWIFGGGFGRRDSNSANNDEDSRAGRGGSGRGWIFGGGFGRRDSNSANNDEDSRAGRGGIGRGFVFGGGFGRRDSNSAKNDEDSRTGRDGSGRGWIFGGGFGRRDSNSANNDEDSRAASNDDDAGNKRGCCGFSWSRRRRSWRIGKKR